MKKKLVIGTFIFIVIAVASFSLRNKKHGLEFKTEKATRGEIISTVTATGTINPVTSVLVGTQVSGTIKNIYVDYNSPVKRGQLLAQIDPATFEAQVEQTSADLVSSKAEAAKAEAALADAKRTAERYRKLFERNLIAKSDLDSAETTYETARAQAAASKAHISQVEASLKYAETNLKYTRILSPVNGIVISRSVDVGQTVAASFQTPTLFTIAKDLTKMQIDTNIDEADIGKIRVGEKAEFSVDAYPDATFRGVVSEVRNAPMVVQNVVTYDVVIRVENPRMKLKPGMTATVSIITERKKDILKVPDAALRYVPTDGEKPAGVGGTCLWVPEGGRPKCKIVTTGISGGNFTEVTSGDIKEGETLITEEISNRKRSSANTTSRPF